MLDVTTHTKDVVQLIFDVNGEYANNNLQDGNSSLYSAYRDRCLVYFLAKREINSRGKLLRFNFYEKQDKLSLLCVSYYHKPSRPLAMCEIYSIAHFLNLKNHPQTLTKGRLENCARLCCTRLYW